MIHKITIQPRDLLYFRDGRPVNDGYGANFPMSKTVYSALSMALNRHWHTPQEWERQAAGGRSRFPSLKTFGPLLKKNNCLYVPTPADLKPGAILAPLRNVPGKSNLPESVLYPVGADLPPSKDSCKPWISLMEFERYLHGESALETVGDEEFFDVEEHPGIAVDTERHSAVDGQFFFSSYLRLKQKVQFCVFADCTIGETDVIAKFFENQCQREIIFGGQRGTAFAECEEYDPSHLKQLRNCGIRTASKLIKWTLISPAAFQTGWRPNFVNEQGKVMLQVVCGAKPERSNFKSREAFREACRKNSRSVNARLVAAVIPKFKTCSGWNLEKQQPERTLRLVPAGSVFYFEAETQEEGNVLANHLTHSRCSEYYGSQGLGVGFCSSYDYVDFNCLIK